MSLSQSNLISWIVYGYYKYKNLVLNITNKYKTGGVVCESDKTRSILLLSFIQELEDYATNCSCLEEEDICNLITSIQSI